MFKQINWYLDSQEKKQRNDFKINSFPWSCLFRNIDFNHSHLISFLILPNRERFCQLKDKIQINIIPNNINSTCAQISNKNYIKSPHHQNNNSGLKLKFEKISHLEMVSFRLMLGHVVGLSYLNCFLHGFASSPIPKSIIACSLDRNRIEERVSATKSNDCIQKKTFQLLMANTELLTTLEEDDPLLPIPKLEREFLINGWRWHARSVLRDLGRFQTLVENEAEQVAQETITKRKIFGSRLVQAHSFLWGFNWAALEKIESTLFFPWLRTSLPRSVHRTLATFERERRSILQLGEDLRVACVDISQTGNTQSLEIASTLTMEINSRTRDLMNMQEGLVMPYVSAYVPAKEQKKFNNKVIKSLGIVNSQIHLVSMADAVANSAEEKAKFKKQIPSVAQAMIPVWRSRLYNPKAKYLDVSSKKKPEEKTKEEPAPLSK